MSATFEMVRALGIAAVVDAVIALTLLEAVTLWLLHRRSGAAARRAIAPREIGLNLLSGLCLMAALHFAVRDARGVWIAGCLLAAGLAHGADLLRRWRHGAAPHGNLEGAAA